MKGKVEVNNINKKTKDKRSGYLDAVKLRRQNSLSLFAWFLKVHDSILATENRKGNGKKRDKGEVSKSARYKID